MRKLVEKFDPMYACRKGNHVWKSGHSIGYGGFEQGSKTCTVCGEYVETWGGKTYEPPYWETGERVVRKGRYDEKP